jgi:hypothetical protein
MTRWELAERFGWTLSEIDALSVGDVHELIQIDDGRRKVHTKPEKVA